MAEEVRITDPQTGGEKGAKLQRFSLIPEEMVWELAEHYGVGAKKYEDRNWEKGYKWSLSYDALRRHLAQWVMGEDLDPETGSHHLIAVIWHATTLFIFQLRGLGTDDLTPRRRFLARRTICIDCETPLYGTGQELRCAPCYHLTSLRRQTATGRV